LGQSLPLCKNEASDDELFQKEGVLTGYLTIGLLFGSSMTELQHLSEGLFTCTLHKGNDLIFRLKFRFPIGNNNLLSTNDCNKD
jgi:hypothetical protein